MSNIKSQFLLLVLVGIDASDRVGLTNSLGPNPLNEGLGQELGRQSQTIEIQLGIGSRSQSLDSRERRHIRSSRSVMETNVAESRE